jgi:peptidoglycan/xylan/chitin deacetylase (PgdA/CDA1 family)
VSWRAPRVLMYHFFGEAPATGDPEGLFVRREALVEQLAWLRRRGWTALTLDEYLAALDGAPVPRRSYLVTIDDGHESVLEIAAPILAEAGVPSVLYVPPGLLGGTVCWSSSSRAYMRERLLTADQLREVLATGMELGVHGHDHTRMQGMDPATAELHTLGARTQLEGEMGVRADTFAYPFGTWDPASRRSVAQAGYRAAFAVAREGGRFAIDRLGVYRTDSLTAFRLKLSLPYRLVSRVAGRTWRLRHLVRDTVRSVSGATTPAGGR